MTALLVAYLPGAEDMGLVQGQYRYDDMIMFGFASLQYVLCHFMLSMLDFRPVPLHVLITANGCREAG